MSSRKYRSISNPGIHNQSRTLRSAEHEFDLRANEHKSVVLAARAGPETSHGPLPLTLLFVVDPNSECTVSTALTKVPQAARSFGAQLEVSGK
jgi:hypothetical protein